MAADKFEDRWGHFRDLVEHLFQEPGRSGVEADVVWYPATDAYETDSTFVIRLDVSGVRREDIQILLRGCCVLVRGIRRDEVHARPQDLSQDGDRHGAVRAQHPGPGGLRAVGGFGDLP